MYISSSNDSYVAAIQAARGVKFESVILEGTQLTFPQAYTCGMVPHFATYRGVK